MDTGSQNKGSALNPGLTTIPRFVFAAAERFGDAPFLTSPAETRTFAQTASNVARGAACLRERGVTPGDRVLISGGNSIATIEAWLSTVHAGAIATAVNPALTEPELQDVVHDLGPRVALLGETQIAALHAQARDIAPAPIPAGEPQDVAGIVYTSGTSSRPKGALVRHLAYVGAGQSMRSWLGLGDAERLWCVLPFFHINAQAYSLMTALANGYPLVVSPKFRASTFWRDAAELGVTEVNVIGAMLAILARQPEEMFVRGALRTIYAAPALDPPDNRALEARFGVRVVTGFGMSECTFGCIETPTSRNKRAGIGRPRTHPDGLVANELRIVTPAGVVASDGTVGELQFRNAALTPGYWNAPEITAHTLHDGWLRTGDAGYVDADGDVVLVGRYKEMIRRRGENIAPREVEDALALHPGVLQAAVVGVPSALSEEEVVACIVRAAGATATEDELRTWSATRLAPYKVPMRILFLEALPLTPTMRVAKERLKTQIAPLLAQVPR